MSTRDVLVVGNWKMNGSSKSANQLISELINTKSKPSIETVICPPYMYLHQSSMLMRDTGIKLGAQDVSEHSAGAFTGDVSASMLSDVGCDYVIIGHSERRQYHGENDELVARKSVSAFNSGLVPIVCVGESEAERRAGKELDVVDSQLTPVLDAWEKASFASIVLAYEPVWAIGTGLTANPEQAQAMHHHIRMRLKERHVEIGAATRILYGGSVKPDNAIHLFKQDDIDGGLIGGASLNVGSFLEIIKAAN